MDSFPLPAHAHREGKGVSFLQPSGGPSGTSVEQRDRVLGSQRPVLSDWPETPKIRVVEASSLGKASVEG